MVLNIVFNDKGTYGFVKIGHFRSHISYQNVKLTVKYEILSVITKSIDIFRI